MSNLQFRDLRADEMECRIATINHKGLSLLVYKDSRVDQNVLDETVGPTNWQKRFYECKGTLFCSVGINVSAALPGVKMTEKELRTIEPFWVWKDDAGAPSNTEAAKGEASDAFKRACFNWGIGRELYTAPFIWIPASSYNVKERNGKPATYDHFRVVKVKTENGAITGLAIANDTTGKLVFTYVKE